MRSVLDHPAYRRLFSAQVLSLLGSGLTTVALGLAAFEIAGADAGIVLGTAFALKMVAYVGLAPLAAALAERLPRRGFLVGLDLARMGLTALLPFVDATWQIYALVFAYQACSAAFTPAFQALIPDLLTEERDYARALSLSRMAYDFESIASPLLAGLLLSLVGFSWLFVGTALGFAASAALIVGTALPARAPGGAAEPFPRRAARGARVYLATPRLRGALALYGAVAAGGSMVIVNTVVHVKDRLGGDDALVAAFFAAFGLGSMCVALLTPRLLTAVRERALMCAGGVGLAAALALASRGVGFWDGLALWAALGAAASAVQTPAGLVLRRSCAEADRGAVFAAQFALSHAGWLIAYPAAGLLGAWIGLDAAMAAMAGAAALATLAALRLWPRGDPSVLYHRHAFDARAVPAPDDPHAGLGPPSAPGAAIWHAHPFVIDAMHPEWPDAAMR